jgi:hypothetical protein
MAEALQLVWKINAIKTIQYIKCFNNSSHYTPINSTDTRWALNCLRVLCEKNTRRFFPSI